MPPSTSAIAPPWRVCPAPSIVIKPLLTVMEPTISPLKVYVVSFLSSKFVVGSTLPSGLIVRVSGSCPSVGEARIRTDETKKGGVIVFL